MTAANRVPVVTIIQPLANDTSPRQLGAPYTFRAEVQDQLNAPELGLCGDVVWTSSDFQDTAFPMTGCQISVAFTTTGHRDVSATYTDPEGATGSARRLILVQEQQPNSPPVVVIDSPVQASTFQEGAAIPLRGSVYLELNEDSPVESGWYLNGVLIGESDNIDFSPGDPGYVTGHSILTFGARDDDGYTETSIDIRIAARPK